MVPRKFAVFTGAFLLSVFLVYQFLPWTPLSSITFDNVKKPFTSKPGLALWSGPKSHSAEVELYFDQVFSPEPASYGYPALKQSCEQAPWSLEGEGVYLNCSGMSAGLTSMISQVKTCLKMAVDSGSNLLLPAMPLRDTENLLQYNKDNPSAYMTYDKWFDVDHFISGMGRACPKMKIIHPDQLKTSEPVKMSLEIDIKEAPYYVFPNSYFWVGRPFKSFFHEQVAKKKAEFEASPEGQHAKPGIIVANIWSPFLIFRILDDPTRHDLALWNELSLIIRFKEQPRMVIDKVLSRMDRDFYGVHFRVEKDNIWSPVEKQLKNALDALDAAWTKFGTTGTPKPLVYLACGDEEQVKIFEKAGKERGWDVVHKWALARGDAETTKMIQELPFDFQGAVDFGIMVKSQFFIGITGSALSCTVSNARDVTGRYRGSSLDAVVDDEGARSHLNDEGDASGYACCL